MSHKTLLLLCALFGILLISACKKDSAEKSPLIGKVLLINSNTPVDKALVRFIRTESNGLFNPVSYYIQQEIITGPDGTFIIPDTTTADHIQAWGLDSIYGGTPSMQIYLASYLQAGGIPKLYLTPPAVLKVRAIDMEPLNPEITHVYFDMEPSTWPNGWTEIPSDGLYWLGKGNIEFFASFKTYSNATNSFEFQQLVIEPINPFDTTEYIFEY
jgi:hypothetical protein